MDSPRAVNFTTGPSTIVDVGVLNYNGCLFSPLYETTLNGVIVKDNAQRTVKYTEYTLTVDGYVTLPAGASSINPTMANLYLRLTQQAANLTYQGRGFDFTITGNGVTRDVAWGPVPEVLDFQPLGAGRSAKVRWQCKFRTITGKPKQFKFGGFPVTLLQFNYETSVSYGEDGFSTLSISGTLEIALTRTLQSVRTVPYTVDTLRSYLDTGPNSIFSGIDLDRFRILNRDFHVSLDKRTLTFNVQAEEKPYVDLPEHCTIARGTYSVRPAKSGMGLALWLCTLRVSYVVPNGRARRIAWLAFLALMNLRMAQSTLGDAAGINAEGDKARGAKVEIAAGIGGLLIGDPFSLYKSFLKAIQNQTKTRKAWLWDFSIEEGMYLDSKTVAFSATWRIVTRFSHILLASGVWTTLPRNFQSGVGEGSNIWKTSMNVPVPGSPSGIMKSSSWLPNTLDPKLDIIVDFGGP